MPDTPIDQSASIQSIRLKVPTGTVPVPPAGYAQLHSPSPGTLALRLPDGSVVEIGGGGGSTPGVLSGTGGVVEAISNPFTGAGVTISPAAGETIFLNGPVVGPGEDQPFGVQVATVPISSAELLALHTIDKVLVPAPGAGKQNQVVGPIFVKFIPGTTPYTAAGHFRIGYATAGGGHDRWFEYQSFLNGWTGGETAVVAPVTSGNNDLPDAEYDSPLVAYATAPYTLGNGTLLAFVPYVTF